MDPGGLPLTFEWSWVLYQDPRDPTTPILHQETITGLQWIPINIAGNCSAAFVSVRLTATNSNGISSYAEVPVYIDSGLRC